MRSACVRGGLTATAAVGCALLAAPASARWFGSTLRAKPNASYGCERALVNGPLGGVQLQPTGQTSCTYRHAGYLYSSRPTFFAPASGRIVRIRVKAGPHPAKLRLTVLTGSSRLTGGGYNCCTARYVGRPFRVRANRVTTKKVNVRVFDVRHGNLHSSDGLALSAVGPGTLPLHIDPSAGGYNAGTPIATSYFPRTRKGDPRVDGYSMPGIDLLFQWDFRRR